MLLNNLCYFIKTNRDIKKKKTYKYVINQCDGITKSTSYGWGHDTCVKKLETYAQQCQDQALTDVSKGCSDAIMTKIDVLLTIINW